LSGQTSSQASGLPVRCRILLPGTVTAEAIVLDEPLSFWGGFDPETGTIIDRRHPQAGARLTGRIVVMPSGRGSSSAGSVLAEAIRAGTAPAAILLAEIDEILVVGALAAVELYGVEMPLCVLPAIALPFIASGDRLTLDRDGTLAPVRTAS
jgi:predicted aconitase with swiveling domain